MDDDGIERLLRGYRPPEAPRALDARVLARAERILAAARARTGAAGLARQLADALGFGYLEYLVDLVTAADAEYRVDLI
jgi:hypothetical protein